MPDIQDVITILGQYISYATGITIIMGLAKAGLSIIYHAITGKD